MRRFFSVKSLIVYFAVELALLSAQSSVGTAPQKVPHSRIVVIAAS